MSRKKYDEIDVRLCRLRPWRTYDSLGFHLQKSSKLLYIITVVESNSPAAAGGLKFWDILLKVNGNDVRKIPYVEIKNIFKSAKDRYDQYVELLVVQGRSYYRNLTDELLEKLSSSVEIITTPPYMPDEYKQNVKDVPRLCEIQLKSHENKFGFDATYGEGFIGVFIQNVKLNSPACRSSLRKCDRIIEINDKYIDKSPTDHIIEIIKKCLIKKYIKLLVIDTQTYEGSLSRNSHSSGSITSYQSDLNDDIYIYSESNPLNANENISDAEDSYLQCSPEPTPVQDSYTVVSDIQEIYTYERFVDIQNEQLTTYVPIEGYEDHPTVSFSTAIKTLDKPIQKIGQKFFKPIDNLTTDESAAIYLYTIEYKSNNHSFCTQLNKILRSNNRELLSIYLPYLKLFFTALNKLKSEQGIGWCGARADLCKRYPIGKTFVWNGFSSCRKSRTLLESEEYLGKQGIRTLFQIDYQTGKSIHLHLLNRSEHEILLLPGTNFQVIDQQILSKDFYLIHLKEIFIFKETLKDFVQKNRIKDQIHFVEQNLTIDNIDFITNEFYSNTNWKKISFTKSNFTEDAIKLFMYSLQANLNIDSLDFISNHFNEKILSIIGRSLRTNTNLKYLNLSNNQLTELDAQVFGSMLTINKTLETIHFSSNSLGDHGMLFINRSLLFNQTLKSLYLNQIQLTNKYTIEMSLYLQQNTSLERLHLNENNLNDESIRVICQALLINKQIKYLHLAKNQITHQCTKDIAMILQEPTSALVEINLSENLFGDKGVQLIVQSLNKNMVLKELYLDTVEITNESLEEFIQMIRVNKTLKILSLKKNLIDQDGINLLLNEMKSNQILEYLYFNDENTIVREIIDNQSLLSEFVRI